MPYTTINDTLYIDATGNVAVDGGQPVALYLALMGFKPGDRINVVKRDELVRINEQAKRTGLAPIA
jgi:Fe2+ transport system protein FeoA